MITYTQAVLFLKLLLQSFGAASKEGILKRLYLYGNLVDSGQGESLDMVFEVDNAVFEAYCGRCGSLFSAAPTLSGAYLRTAAAFEVIRFDIDSFLSAQIGTSSEMHARSLNVVCLPVGWDTPESGDDVCRLLWPFMPESKDPYFLLWAAASCLEITA